MLRVYTAKLYRHNYAVSNNTRGWYLVIDDNDFVAEFIHGGELLEIAERHSQWFSWLNGDYALTTSARAVGREAEYLSSEFSGVFIGNGNCYCIGGGNSAERFYLLDGNSSVLEFYAELSFYLEGLKFVYGSGTVYVNDVGIDAEIVICVDDNDRLLGVFVSTYDKLLSLAVHSMVKATVCDERVKEFVAKYAMLKPDLYGDSFMAGLVRVV